MRNIYHVLCIDGVPLKYTELCMQPENPQRKPQSSIKYLYKVHEFCTVMPEFVVFDICILCIYVCVYLFMNFV